MMKTGSKSKLGAVSKDTTKDITDSSIFCCKI